MADRCRTEIGSGVGSTAVVSRTRCEAADRTTPGTETSECGSTAQELQTGANVCQYGTPRHTPDVARQTYTNILTGVQYQWFIGTWTHE